jgi:hypothetical protein
MQLTKLCNADVSSVVISQPSAAHTRVFRGSSDRPRSVRSQYSLEGKVTNEDLVQAPWARPGWRGAWVSSQPEAVQAAIVAGMYQIMANSSRS